MIHDAFPQYIDGGNVLRTGLNNMGAIFHPALTLLNAGRIESTRGDFQFYIDGVTPSVARVLEVIDRERVTVAAALGIRARRRSGWRWRTMQRAIHSMKPFRTSRATTVSKPRRRSTTATFSRMCR